MEKSVVVGRVRHVASWWLQERIKKVRDANHGTMEVNPFMAPMISALHGYTDFDGLSEFLLGGHFSIGHATGFGKLIDEKLLPAVFETTKLDKAERTRSGYVKSCFDNVDHVVKKGNTTTFLSLKAGKWTIQLGQAVNLNTSFKEIDDMIVSGELGEANIVVGAFYGKASNLTDKYRLIMGVSAGANHDVVDLRHRVSLLSGAEFWAWIGEHEDTQSWVLEGILDAINHNKAQLAEAERLLANYKETFSDQFSEFCADGEINWYGILKQING